MISRIAEKSNHPPYIFKSFPLLPLWKRAEESALFAFSAIANGLENTSKCGREISVRAAPGRLFVKLKPLENLDGRVNAFPICSEADKAYISELLKILDEANLISLSVKMFQLAEVGSHIPHVHPFTFLKTILTEPILRMRLKRIFDSPCKRLGMMNRSLLSNGFSYQLQTAHLQGNLEPYIEAFSASVNVPAEEIRPLIQSAAWHELCVHLLEKTSPRSEEAYPA